MDNKLLIYLAYHRPVITYASPIWACTAKSNLHKLETLENKTIRMIVNAHWYQRTAEIRHALNIPSLKQFIHKLSTKFYTSLPSIENPEISKIPNYDITDNRNRKRPRLPSTCMTPSNSLSVFTRRDSLFCLPSLLFLFY
ncbi:hypothetical protein AVEN_48883-1 [Araneus ventricosus]|uniref:RNA-directed DNA polymerase from mobile element jockey n=1 Tax=Araneus ventricosus TaxID=182803 RepID=A0A4Y2AH12_ARAVE|nr:hypothetical protein AVEN_48883-1 [Araneus ventricosus]